LPEEEIPVSHPVDLVVPNVAEFNLRHPRLSFDPATVDSFLRFGAAMSDQSVFWSDGPRVLVLPDGVDQHWLEDVHGMLGATPSVVRPHWRSGRISADLLADEAAMAALTASLDGHDPVRIVSWGASDELYRLVTAIEGLGHRVLLDVPPEQRYWSSLYLDSKISCTDLATRVPGLRVAPGITVDTWPELHGVLEVMRADGDAVIVRGVYGTGGEGSAIVGPGPEELERFWRTLRDDPLLRVFPLLVQKYLTLAPGVGSPAVDLLISAEHGGIADIVPSVMTVERHRFVSVDVGGHVLPAAMTQEMTDIAHRVASAALRLGFEGWFGIDFIVDHHDDLYVTEFNARRTGGTQWIPLLERWHPARHAVAHARHAVPLPDSAPAGVTYDDLAPAFHRLRADGIEVFPTTVRGLGMRHRTYGIMAGGHDRAEANDHAEEAVRAVSALFEPAELVSR
jgi:hypothetical protein